VDAVNPQRNVGAECLAAHNRYRALHQDTQPLEWDSQLEEDSRAWAEYLASVDDIQHSSPDNGENLFWGDGSDKVTCDMVVQTWYDEGRDYSYQRSRSVNSNEINYFTQVVWRPTRSVGMAMAESATGQIYFVARYKPKGNFVVRRSGERLEEARRRVFAQEVARPKSLVQININNPVLLKTT